MKMLTVVKASSLVLTFGNGLAMASPFSTYGAEFTAVAKPNSAVASSPSAGASLPPVQEIREQLINDLITTWSDEDKQRFCNGYTRHAPDYQTQPKNGAYIAAHVCASIKATEQASEDNAEITTIPHAEELRRSIVERQFIPILQGLPGVLEYASQTLAAQVIGAATTLGQLEVLCQNADRLLARLHLQGYDTDYMKNDICTAANQTRLATDAEIQAQTLRASSKIWVVQALGSTLGNQKALCNIFSREGGDNVGLNGTFVKNEICGAGG